MRVAASNDSGEPRSWSLRRFEFGESQETRLRGFCRSFSDGLDRANLLSRRHRCLSAIIFIGAVGVDEFVDASSLKNGGMNGVDVRSISSSTSRCMSSTWFDRESRFRRAFVGFGRVGLDVAAVARALNVFQPGLLVCVRAGEDSSSRAVICRQNSLVLLSSAFRNLTIPTCLGGRESCNFCPCKRRWRE